MIKPCARSDARDAEMGRTMASMHADGPVEIRIRPNRIRAW
jgi:hypothetical protein